jgi:CubicO group peptidase (beta-lactamase class C family)
MTKPFHAVDRLMHRAVFEGIFPGGVILVAVQGKVVFRRAYGLADRFSRRPMACETVFDLASLTKPLATTLAAMHLVQRGLLVLDQPCCACWPDFFKGDKASITVRHLLGHSSGLPAWRPYYLRMKDIRGQERRKAVVEEWMAREPLLSPPGRRACYSDIGFLVLQGLIERVAQTTLDRYLEASIWKSLSVEGLFFNASNRPPVEADYAATELCPWRGRLLVGRVHDDNAYVMGGVCGHAGLFGSADAVWNLLQNLLFIETGVIDDGPFESSLVKKFFQRQKGTDWALGFDTPAEVGSSAGRCFSPESVGHLGFTGTSFWMDRRKGIIVILLTNRVHPSRHNGRIKSFRPLLHDAVMEHIDGV